MTRTPLQDKTFGTLTWDDALDYWTGQAEISGVGLVRISIDSEGSEDTTPETALANARRAYLAFRDNEPAARAFAVAALLDMHNQAWNTGEATEEEAFVAKMVLEDISFLPDGSAELFYQAGDLFGGHSVIVTLDEDGDFEDADLAG